MGIIFTIIGGILVAFTVGRLGIVWLTICSSFALGDDFGKHKLWQIILAGLAVSAVVAIAIYSIIEFVSYITILMQY